MTASYAWLVWALLSSVAWGFGYAISGHLVKTYPAITPAFLIFAAGLITLPLYTLSTFFLKQMQPGFELMTSNPHVLGMVILTALAVVLGNNFILMSMTMKHAAIANLIEISYPAFTCLFAWLLFKDMPLTPSTLFGAALIFSGVAVIFFRN